MTSSEPSPTPSPVRSSPHLLHSRLSMCKAAQPLQARTPPGPNPIGRYVRVSPLKSLGPEPTSLVQSTCPIPKAAVG